MQRKERRMCSDIPPEEMTAHMLISEIARTAHNEARAVRESLNITPSYRSILFFLSHEDGLTQLELSNLTRLKPPTVSVTLKNMEDDGYVERKSDPADKRAIRVYITEKGRNFDDRIKGVYMYQDKIVAEALTKEEAEQLKSLLIKIRTAMSIKNTKEND